MQLSSAKAAFICALLITLTTAHAQINRKGPLQVYSTHAGTELPTANYQTSPDSIYKDGIIEIKKSGGKTLYILGDSLLTERKLAPVFAGNTVCASYYKSSQTFRATTNGFLIASIISLGIAGITYATHNGKSKDPDTKNEYNPSFLYTGLACIGISIPLTLVHHIYLGRAIQSYNQQQYRRTTQPELHLKASTQSIGIVVSL